MDQLPSDSESLSHDTGPGGDGAAYIAKQLSDRVDRANLDPWRMEDLKSGRQLGSPAFYEF